MNKSKFLLNISVIWCFSLLKRKIQKRKERNTMITKRLRNSTYAFVALWSWIFLIENLHAAWLGELMLSMECWLNWVEAINPLCLLLMVPEDSGMMFYLYPLFLLFPPGHIMKWLQSVRRALQFSENYQSSFNC